MGTTKEVTDRIQEIANECWDHNKCSNGGVVDRDYFQAMTADIYEKAMLDAMCIHGEDSAAAQEIEKSTGFTLKGK